MTLHNKTRAELEAVQPYVYETIKDAMLLRVLDDFSIWALKEDKSVTPSLLWHGHWESWITSWFTKNVRDGMFVVDVGANCGYYTMLFDRLVGEVGQVWAFECQPVYTELLEDTKHRNNANFILSHFAVSDDVGWVDLRVPGAYTGSASIVQHFEESETIRVPTVSLDQSFHNIIPDLIKIDAEGAEELIWRGMKNLLNGPLAPVVVLEYTPGQYTDEWTDELFEYGNVTKIGFTGEEEEVTAQDLRHAKDWVMIVVRRKV